MIIKATRLQAWTSAGGEARVGRRHPPPSKIPKKFFGNVEGLFATFFLFLGAFSPLFTSWWGPFMGLPPPPTKILLSTHDCKEGSRACSPEIFLCDRNLVSSGDVLLRFCLKYDKNSDKL